MTPTTKKQTRFTGDQRARAPRPTAAETRAPTRRARQIAWLAAAATLWAAVPPIWPGLGRRPNWSTVLFVVAVGMAAMFVRRTVAELRHPADTTASAKTAVLLVLVVVVPVLFDARTLDRYNLPKFTVTVIGALAIATLWVVEAATPGSLPRWRSGLHWPVLALAGWTAIATATSSSPRLSVLGAMFTNDGLLAAGALVVIFFAVVQVITLHHVKAVLSVLYFGAGGPTILYGLVQLHDRLVPGGRWDWIRTINGEGTQSFAGGGIFSTFGNPNHLGGFLAVLVPIGLVLLMLHTPRPVRILTAAIMAGVLVQLLQTASRGALLAALVALGVAGALLWPEVHGRLRTILPAGAVGMAVVVGAVALTTVPGFSSKLSAGLRAGEAFTLRSEIWKVGVVMANDRPLVGHGPDTWVDEAPKYRDPQTARRLGPNYNANGAHNLLIGQLAATGYPGLLLLVAVLGFAALRAIGAWRRLRQVESDGKEEERGGAREARLCLVAVVAGLAAFLVQGSFNLSQTGLSFVFWLLLGLLCVVSLGVGVSTSLRPQALVSRPMAPAGLCPIDHPQTRTLRAGHQRVGEGSDIATGAVTVLACLGLALAGSVATRPLRADHNAAASLFDQVVARRSSPADAARLTRLASTRLSKAISLNPWEAYYLATHADGSFSSALSLPAGSPAQTAALRTARRDYQRVVELRPRSPSFLQRYAEILLKIHEIDSANGQARAEAIRALHRAVNGDPHSPFLRERLRQALGA